LRKEKGAEGLPYVSRVLLRRRLKRVSRRSAEELPLGQRKRGELTSRCGDLRGKPLVELTEEEFWVTLCFNLHYTW
jgi:hypothetical protein